MLFGLKKKPVFATKVKGVAFDPSQLIEPILWVDGVVSGGYQAPPSSAVYVNLSDEEKTTGCLSEMYPEWEFYAQKLQNGGRKNLRLISALQPSQQVHYIYLGNKISFLAPREREVALEFVHKHLAPGGYVVVGYEAEAGWSQYKVVIDLIRELTLEQEEPIDLAWLDKVFFELYKLAELKISVFQNKKFLERLLNYLKSLPYDHLEKILKSKHFHTFYPNGVHKLLLGAHKEGLNFVGSLPISRNYLHLGLTSEQKQFLGSSEMSVMGAQRQDLILMPLHRMDIWKKPVEKINRQERLSNFYLGCISDFEYFPSNVQCGHLKINFSDAIYTKLREICGDGFKSINQIVNSAKTFAPSLQEIADRLMMLVMSGQVAYTRTPPVVKQTRGALNKIGKLRFVHAENTARFSNIRSFITNIGVVVVPGKGMAIPFDQKTSAVMVALTKVHESFVPQYCAEAWKDYDDSLDLEVIKQEFKSVLRFFKCHYLGKFLALGLLDQVLVEQQHIGIESTWTQK